MLPLTSINQKSTPTSFQVNSIPKHWKDVLSKTWTRNRVHNSDELDEVLEVFRKACSSTLKGQVKVHHFKPGEVYNHWIIPPRWNLKAFELRGPNGKLIASLADSPLAVACYSESVDLKLSLGELKEKIVTRADLPDAYSFLFRGMYRHWEKSWQLSLPYSIVSRLTEGEYHVRIESERNDKPMPVFEYEWKGQSDKIVFLAGHIDHPAMVNDGLSGCLAALQAIEMLEQRVQKPLFTYRVLLVPEIIGSAVYLKRFEDVVPRVMFSLCPNMTSHDAPLAMCRSKSTRSLLDQSLRMALWETGENFLEGAFHAYPDCGDEISFDAVGYEIPSPTLSRRGESFGFYHTSNDNLTRFLEPAAQARHQRLVEILARSLEILELNFSLNTSIRGNPCLSNPNLGLYLNTSNVNNRFLKENVMRSFDGKPVDLRNFMEFFLDSLAHRGVSVLEIAHESQLPFDFVWNYARQFVEKGLVQSLPCERRESLNRRASTSLYLAGLVGLGEGL